MMRRRAPQARTGPGLQERTDARPVAGDDHGQVRLAASLGGEDALGVH
ncbi:MAG: hypothetical protein K0Q58_1405, partial [Microbacterium sp.]|nr:hypothetical protein [Microbacterium sp.]